MKDELKKLFEGVDGFKPEFLTQITGLVESKVEEGRLAGLQEAEGKFDAEILALRESHAAEIAQLQESHIESLVTKLDGFLNEAVLEWANENAPAIDSNLKVEMAEKLMSGLTGLLGEAQISVSGSDDVVTDLQARLQTESQRADAAEHQLNEINEAAIQLQRDTAINKVCEGLADTQKDRIVNLLEGTAFTTPEAFAARVQRFRSLIEGDKPNKEEDGEGKDGKDKEGKDKGDKDEAGKEVNESVAAQIAAALALRKPVNG